MWVEGFGIIVKQEALVRSQREIFMLALPYAIKTKCSTEDNIGQRLSEILLLWGGWAAHWRPSAGCKGLWVTRDTKCSDARIYFILQRNLTQANTCNSTQPVMQNQPMCPIPLAPTPRVSTAEFDSGENSHEFKCPTVPDAGFALILPKSGSSKSTPGQERAGYVS